MVLDPPPKLKNEQREKAHDKAVSVSGGGDGHNTAAVYGCKKFDHIIWLEGSNICVLSTLDLMASSPMSQILIIGLIQ